MNLALLVIQVLAASLIGTMVSPDPVVSVRGYDDKQQVYSETASFILPTPFDRSFIKGAGTNFERAVVSVLNVTVPCGLSDPRLGERLIHDLKAVVREPTFTSLSKVI